MKMSILSTFFLIFASLLMNSSLTARVIIDHYQNHPENSLVEAEEALVAVSLPIELVQREVRNLVLTEGSVIKELSRLDFDPIGQLMIVEGEIEIPTIVLNDFQSMAGDRDLQQLHPFKLTLSFPSSHSLALTSFFQITIHRLELSGQDYSKAFGVLGRFASVILSNSSFVDYILDIDEAVSLSEVDDTSLRLRQFIERKNIRFRENTISFKLNLNEFTDFKRFSELTELRLWQFAPVLLKGKRSTVFRIEAGIGSPHELWVNDSRARGEGDQRTLEQAREQLYAEYENTQALKSYLAQMIEEGVDQLGLTPYFERTQREIQEFKQQQEHRIDALLSTENIEFKADPVKTYNLTQEIEKERVISFLTDLKRRVSVEQQMVLGDTTNKNKPFLQKRLSQRAVNHAVRFFRDIEIDEHQKLFDELNVIIAPHLPGLIVRGRVNMDLNSVFALAVEGTGVEVGNIPIRPSQEQWGSGLPFQAAIRLYMLDEGELALDIKNISLFTGLQRITIEQSSPHGAFMVNFIKMVMTQTLLTTLIEQPFSENTDSHQQLLRHIQSQREHYQRSLSQINNQNNISGLLELTRLDIETNPFLLLGRDFVAGKTELFFKELIKFDETDQLIKVQLDPKVISDTILSSDNSVQVWNVESLYDSQEDQTYLEVALGDSNRSQAYIDEILNREINRESQLFSSTQDQASNADVKVQLDLQNFTQLVSHILNESSIPQREAAESAFSRDEESEFYIIQNLDLKARHSNRLSLSVVLSHLQKKKRSGFNPRSWLGDKFEESRKSIAIESELILSVEELSKYESQIARHDQEVFLSNTLLKVDLRQANIQLDGQLGLIDRMINLVGRDINFDQSSLARKVKVLVLRFVGNMLNPTDIHKSGNVNIGGLKLNKYVKLFTHREEILLQVHPHILSSAFDVSFKDAKVSESIQGTALKINPEQQSIEFDFQVVGNMASVDKAELFSVMNEAKSLIAPILDIQDSQKMIEELNSLKLFDQFFHNSDLTKPSLRHRFLTVLSAYEGLLEASDPDLTYVQALHRQLHLSQGFESNHTQGKKITSCGVELMYFLTTAMVMRSQVQELTRKIESMELSDQVQYFDDFKRFSSDLRDRFIIPLGEMYEQRFLKRNQKILSLSPSDWTYSYYPDALYAQSVYLQLRDHLRNEKQSR